MVEKIDPTDGAVFANCGLITTKPLAQVADEQNSIAFISKFEQGKSNISFSRLSHLLFRINMSSGGVSLHSRSSGRNCPAAQGFGVHYNTLIHRDLEAVLAFQDPLALKNQHWPTIAIYLSKRKSGSNVTLRITIAKPSSNLSPFRIFRLTMIDRVKAA